MPRQVWTRVNGEPTQLKLGLGAGADNQGPPASSLHPWHSPGTAAATREARTCRLEPRCVPDRQMYGTTRGPFFSHKVVMCSRQKPNLGCFGPKETFTTKLYTSENKWAFILERNPAGLFIICTTVIKLVLISAVECHWVGQVAGSGGWSGDHFTLRNTQWEAKGSISPETFFLRSLVCWFYLFLECSLQLPSRFPSFSFSFPLFKKSRVFSKNVSFIGR